MRNNILVEEQLTPEGLAMWENIANLEKLAKGKTLLDKTRKVKVNFFELEVLHIRTELRRMIYNSEMVIRDCENIIAALKTKEEYLTCEARVAKTVHENLIIRLTNILNMGNAFEHEVVVDAEPDRPYKEINGKQDSNK